MPPLRTVARRSPRLLVGLVLYGVGIALQVVSGLGLGPWNVLHTGLAETFSSSIGVVMIVVGILVLLAWIPLRVRPGIGTIANVFVIGLALDATLWLLPDRLPGPWLSVAAMVAGPAIIGLGTGLYIGADLGTGPRDGLMTGIAARGHDIARTRTGIEVTVLLAGIALGGSVGIGTVVEALTIGFWVRFFLHRLPSAVATPQPPSSITAAPAPATPATS